MGIRIYDEDFLNRRRDRIRVKHEAHSIRYTMNGGWIVDDEGILACPAIAVERKLETYAEKREMCWMKRRRNGCPCLDEEEKRDHDCCDQRDCLCIDSLSYMSSHIKYFHESQTCAFCAAMDAQKAARNLEEHLPVRDVVDTVMDYVSPRPSHALHRLPRGSDGRIAWGSLVAEKRYCVPGRFIVECDDLHVTVARWFHWDDMCSKLTNALLLPAPEQPFVAEWVFNHSLDEEEKFTEALCLTLCALFARTAEARGTRPDEADVTEEVDIWDGPPAKAKFSRGFLVESGCLLFGPPPGTPIPGCWGDRAFESDYTFVAIRFLSIHMSGIGPVVETESQAISITVMPPPDDERGFAFRTHDRVIVVFVPDQLSIWDIMEDKFKSVVNLRPK